MKKIPLSLLALALVTSVAGAQVPAAPAGAPAGAAAPVAAVPGGPPPTPTAPPAVKVPTLSPEEQGYYLQEQALARQLRLLTIQAQIAEQQRKILGDNGGGAAAAGTDSVNLPPQIISRSPQPAAQPARAEAAPAAPALSMDEPLPFRLLSTWGTDGRMAADVISGGLRVTVRSGDALPGGWRVAQVARTGMVIRNGRAKRTLIVGG